MKTHLVVRGYANPIEEVLATDLESELGIADVVRFHQEEFGKIDSSAEFLTHFYLHSSTNEVGSRYGVVPIIGRSNEGELVDDNKDTLEYLPVLDINRAIYAECVEIDNHSPTLGTPQHFFTDSISSIKTPLDLEKAIHARYGHFEEHKFKSAQALNAMGVSISKFKLER